MNAKNIRKATRHFTAPVRAQHLKSCLKWQRKFNWLEGICREVSPKIAPEILPEIISPAVRFASRRATDQGESQTLSRFALCSGEHEYGIGAIDRDEIAGGEERELTPILPVEPLENEVSE